MAEPGQELSSIDFESMIGGPLNAVIKAQAQAAITSVDFIKAVGFDPDEENKPVMVTFAYDKEVEEIQEDGTTTVEVKPFTLTVPILTMLPIPFIRVEETTIDFNAKITSVQASNTTTKTGVEVDLEKKAGLFFLASSKLKANFSHQRTRSERDSVKRTYTLAVHVRAVQDELPAGTDRLLGILENTITEVPASA